MKTKLALLSTALILGATGCSATTEEPTVESATGGAAVKGKSKVARVGDKVTLKGTTYRVTKVRTSQSIGKDFMKEQANGRFVVIKLQLTNRKDEPAMIISENLRLIGGNGKNYSTSDDALFAVDKPLLLEEIQPDNTEKGTLVYDVPKGAVKGAALRVEDLFSDSKASIDLGL